MNTAPLQLKIDRARYWLLSAMPSYGALACRLADVISNSVPTACTNGKRIAWGAQFLDGLTNEEVRFILAHETLHCAHGHLWRFAAGMGEQEVQHGLDHTINLLLQGTPGMQMPEGGYCDPRFRGLAEEEVIAILRSEKMRQQDNGEDGDGNGNGGESQDGHGKPGKPDPCGDFEAPGDGDKDGDGNAAGGESDDEADGDGPADDGQNLREQWERAVIQQAMASKAAGRGAGALERQIARLRAHKVDWRAETAAWLKSATPGRNDWSRSARRMAGQPVIYPRRKTGDLGLVLIVRDTSGSVDGPMLDAFTATATAALAETGAEGLVIDCDDGIRGEYRVSRGEAIPDQAKGGGGTEFSAPFRRAAELEAEGERIAGIVYLTDLEGYGFPTVEAWPTLTICTTSLTAPSGRTIHVNN